MGSKREDRRRKSSRAPEEREERARSSSRHASRKRTASRTEHMAPPSPPGGGHDSSSQHSQPPKLRPVTAPGDDVDSTAGGIESEELHEGENGTRVDSQLEKKSEEEVFLETQEKNGDSSAVRISALEQNFSLLSDKLDGLQELLVNQLTSSEPSRKRRASTGEGTVAEKRQRFTAQPEEGEGGGSTFPDDNASSDDGGDGFSALEPFDPTANKAKEPWEADDIVIRFSEKYFKHENQCRGEALESWQKMHDWPDNKPDNMVAPVLNDFLSRAVIENDKKQGESSQKKFRDIFKKPSDDPQYLFPPDLGSKAKEMASEDKAVSGLLQKEGSTNKASGSSQNFRRGGGAGSGEPTTAMQAAATSHVHLTTTHPGPFAPSRRGTGSDNRRSKHPIYYRERGPAFDRTAKCTSSVSAASCRQGYKLEFATTPPIQGRLPLSRPRDDAQAAVIDEEVRTLLTKGAVTEVPYHHTQFVSTLFTVPKKTGGLRPVINLKPLNKFLHKQRFKMESLRLIKHLVRPGDYMAKLDLTDAYFTIPVHKDDRKYLTFHWRGRFYQFQCLPFGVATAPRVFTKVMKVPIALLRRRGFRLVVYLDDILVIARSREMCRKVLQAAIDLISSMGFVPNLSKSVLEPTQRITFLGSGIDSTLMVMYLPEDKVSAIQQMADTLLSTDCPVSARDLAGIIGKLQATAPSVWHAPLHFRNLQRLLIRALRTSRGHWEGQVSLTAAARTDLVWWRDQLANANSRPILAPSADLEVESDASGTGWGGFCNGVHTGGRWTERESRAHINVLELQAASMTVRAFCKDIENGHVRVHSDNSTVVAYLNRLGGTRSLALLNATLDLWQWCADRNLSLSAKHIAGRENIRADFCSRHFSVATEWSLERNTQGVDLFASRTNRQLEQYVSWHPEAEAMGTDAFTLRWNEWELAYAFPPFKLIPPTLQKVREDRAQVILIAPVWDTAVWYPVLLEMVVEEPILLPQHEHLLIQVESGLPHPEGSKLQLAAWHVCGDNMRCTAFRQRAGTQRQYSSAWDKWSSWCRGRDLDPVCAPLSQVLEFLLSQHERGLQYRTVNVYRSAISSTHLPLEGRPLGEHPLMRRFMKGLFELRPPLPKYSFTWDVRQVLDFLRRWSPANSLSLRQLTLKLAMLVALVSAGREQTLSFLDVKLKRRIPGGVCFRVEKLTKTSRPGSVIQEIIVPKFEEDRHSTRSASTSAAQLQGVSTKDIMRTANWSSCSTWERFYKKPVVSLPPCQIILEVWWMKPSRVHFGQESLQTED
ncbi:hypothetical protein Bbelb_414820 [Branchiostoma belcheri]|nr:hypothetical protein Bbelb_414820 [Branchiostoma belcheri]